MISYDKIDQIVSIVNKYLSGYSRELIRGIVLKRMREIIDSSVEGEKYSVTPLVPHLKFGKEANYIIFLLYSNEKDERPSNFWVITGEKANRYLTV